MYPGVSTAQTHGIIAVVAMPMNDLGQPIGRSLPGWKPRPHPKPVVFEGEWCRVVPLALEHALPLYKALNADGDERRWTYMSFGPFAGPAVFEEFVTGSVNDPSALTFAISHKHGEPTGMANYLRMNPSDGSVEVGRIVLGPEIAKTAAATESMYLMARHVFDELGYRRYEWKCDSLNTASRRAALRLGFQYEGTSRNAVVYKGRSRDTAWFSMTDHDWRYVKPALEAWLAPDNFKDDRQLTTLSSHMTYQ